MHKPVPGQAIDSLAGSGPDGAGSILVQVGGVVTGQPVGRGVVANLSVAQAAHGLGRGDPQGTVARRNDAGNDVARQPLSLRILRKATVAKAENTAAVSPYPEVMVGVLSQSPHAAIDEAVPFVVGSEASSVKQGKAAAVSAGPK